MWRLKRVSSRWTSFRCSSNTSLCNPLTCVSRMLTKSSNFSLFRTAQNRRLATPICFLLAADNFNCSAWIKVSRFVFGSDFLNTRCKLRLICIAIALVFLDSGSVASLSSKPYVFPCCSRLVMSNSMRFSVLTMRSLNGCKAGTSSPSTSPTRVAQMLRCALAVSIRITRSSASSSKRIVSSSILMLSATALNTIGAIPIATPATSNPDMISR